MPALSTASACLRRGALYTPIFFWSQWSRRRRILWCAIANRHYHLHFGQSHGRGIRRFYYRTQEIIALLRQKSRPYQFSNTLAPAIVNAAIVAFGLLESGKNLRRCLMENTARFRAAMEDMGFDVSTGIHPIVPILFRRHENDAVMAQKFARKLYENGVYAVGFFFPVVPRGQARIRVQISAAHTKEHIDKAIEAFRVTGKELGVI